MSAVTLTVSTLLDGAAEFGDRDDAAMALALSDAPEAERALLAVASDKEADVDLSDRCGESLARIWCRRGTVDAKTIERLNTVARRIALATIEALSPSLSEVLRRHGLKSG